MHCRVNRVRTWQGRMILEAQDHPYSAFVTLTYNDEHLPEDNNVCKVEMQNFLKRLRKQIQPRKIKYFAVGEYGEKSWRPHYHLIIFGLSPSEQKTVEKCWTKGYVQVGTAEPSSMSYCCGYVLKKMTKSTDSRLNGRKPEFSLMSKREPIGIGVVKKVEKALASAAGQKARKILGDNVKTIRAEGKRYPLGRTVKEKIYATLGTDDKQRRENARRTIEEQFAKELTLGVTETQRRRTAAIHISKAKAKAAKTFLTRRLL